MPRKYLPLSGGEENNTALQGEFIDRGEMVQTLVREGLMRPSPQLLEAGVEAISNSMEDLPEILEEDGDPPFLLPDLELEDAAGSNLDLESPEAPSPEAPSPETAAAVEEQPAPAVAPTVEPATPAAPAPAAPADAPPAEPIPGPQTPAAPEPAPAPSGQAEILRGLRRFRVPLVLGGLALALMFMCNNPFAGPDYGPVITGMEKEIAALKRADTSLRNLVETELPGALGKEMDSRIDEYGVEASLEAQGLRTDLDYVVADMDDRLYQMALALGQVLALASETEFDPSDWPDCQTQRSVFYC